MPETRIDLGPIQFVVTLSDGTDGAMVVFIDTSFEPDGSDGSCGLRVIINDDEAYAGVAHETYLEPPADHDRIEFYVFKPAPERAVEGRVFGPTSPQERQLVLAVDHDHARRLGANLFGVPWFDVTAMPREAAEAFAREPIAPYVPGLGGVPNIIPER